LELLAITNIQWRFGALFNQNIYKKDATLMEDEKETGVNF
jgi:hypothetical protein